MTLPPLPSPQRSLGYALVSWYEHYLVHGPGDVQGEQIRLDHELAGFVVRAYEVDKAGRRVWDEAMLSRPKGRAKSELGGMFGCGEGLAPVRFDHWAAGDEEPSPWGYRYEPGEPVGQPVTYPFLRCLATEENQAENTYGNIAYMLAHVAEQFGGVYPGIDLGRDWQTSTRIYLPGGGVIIPSTASSAAKDGGKETWACFDEPHLYKLPELRSMYRTVKRNLAKRRIAEPWGLLTSTMYAPGEDSTCEQVHEAVRKGKAFRLLLDHKGVSEPVDLADDAALERALRFVYGPAAGWMDVPRLMAQLRDPQMDENEQRRYFLNERVAGSARWVDPKDWAARADASVVVADGTPVTVGFDGSISRDSTTLLGCTRDRHWFVIGMWERPTGPAGDGWVVPQLEVDAAVRAAFARYRVLRLYGDPREYKAWLAAWAEEFGAKRVLEFPTNSAGRFAPAVLAADSGIRTGELSHDGDARLARHVANAHKLYVRLRVDDGERRPFVLQKDRPHSPRKIDGAVAGILADAARNDALAAGEFESDDQPFFAAWR